MVPANVDVLRECIDAFSRRELEEAMEWLDPETVWEVGPEMLLEAGRYHGREGVRRFWRLWHDMFEAFELVIESCEDVDARHVIAITRARGRGAGSGASVESLPFAQLAEIGDGQIKRLWMYGRPETALRAAGADA